MSPEDILEAANIFLGIHDFDLAETYFDKAKLAGANPRLVEIGLANTYVAEGETHKAEEALASLGPVEQFYRRLRLHDCGGELVPAATGYGACALFLCASQHGCGTGQSGDDADGTK